MAIFTGKGTQLQLGDGISPDTYTTVGQVRSITGPTTKAVVVDVTTLATQGNFMQKLEVLIDPGDLTFPMNYDAADTTHQFLTGMWNLFLNLTQRNFKLIFSHSAGTLKFAGFVSGHAFNVPVNNVLDANIQITVQGAIVGTNP